MKKIIACLDGSPHAVHVLQLALWVQQKTNFDVVALHVISPHAERANHANTSGAIGLGAKSDLLEKLAEMDAQKSKIEAAKGQVMLDHATAFFADYDITIEQLHRRGTLVDTLNDVADANDIVIIGKRGENANGASEHLGSNLERVVRATKCPIMIATQHDKEIKRFLIAYDGDKNITKAVDYLAHNTLPVNATCHLLNITKPGETQVDLDTPAAKLREAGYDVETIALQSDKPATAVTDYCNNHEMDMLVTGAYGHSKLRNMILGSTTSALIHNSKAPILLFR